MREGGMNIPPDDRSGAKPSLFADAVYPLPALVCDSAGGGD